MHNVTMMMMEIDNQGLVLTAEARFGFTNVSVEIITNAGRYVIIKSRTATIMNLALKGALPLSMCTPITLNLFPAIWKSKTADSYSSLFGMCRKSTTEVLSMCVGWDLNPIPSGDIIRSPLFFLHMTRFLTFMRPLKLPRFACLFTVHYDC
jgi:hypothetical protein